MLCCCPGTITADLAALVPQGHVTGLEHAPDVLEQARATAARRGLANIDFAVGDMHALDYPDGVFDVVHAHQVLHCVDWAKTQGIGLSDPGTCIRALVGNAPPPGVR